MPEIVIISILCGCLVSAALVPIVRALFRWLGIVDKPDKERKLHASAVSLGGGLAVFFSVAITFAIVLSGDRYVGEGLLGYLGGPGQRVVGPSPTNQSALSAPALADPAKLATRHGEASSAAASAPASAVDGAGEITARLNTPWYFLFAAAGVLMVVGLIDDAFTLRGRQKLLLQILVVVSVVGGGTLVESFSFFGSELHLGIFAYPLTVLWLLAAINALNLIDGADGMASTAGAIISLGLAVLCVQSGAYLGAAVAAALAGSLLGFLIYNRPPATIYLGDAGSMVIGLFVGVISIWSSVEGSTLLSFAPLMVLTIPLFDSTIAILRRLLTGRSIYATDRGHLHHRLLDRFSHRVMLVVVAVLCSITTAAAILSVQLEQQWIAIGGVMLAVGMLVFTRSFGNAELKMLFSRTSSFGESLLTRSHNCESFFHHKSVQLQGNRCWDAIWTSLVEFATDRGLVQIKLDVAIAWMQEGYHGSWRRMRLPEKADQASLKMPICIGERRVGRLEAVGDARRADIADTLQLLVERAVDLESQIERLMESEPSRPVVGSSKLPPAEPAHVVDVANGEDAATGAETLRVGGGR